MRVSNVATLNTLYRVHNTQSVRGNAVGLWQWQYIMDNIILGISRISLEKSLGGIGSENCATNFAKVIPANMSILNGCFSDLEESVDHGKLNCLAGDSLTLVGNEWKEIKDGEDKNSQNRDNRKSYTFSERRKMPNRASKESSSLGINRRTIMKPAKRPLPKHEDFQYLKPADIKKIYLNKKLTNFKPSSLETIFEEAHSESNDQNCTRLMSVRKIRRSLRFSDGHKYTKSLVNKRRKKIKKNFGKRFAFKKLSLEEFITKLNSSMEEGESSTNTQQRNEECKISETENQSDCFGIFSTDTNTSNIVIAQPNMPSNTNSMECSTDFSF